MAPLRDANVAEEMTEFTATFEAEQAAGDLEPI